MTMMTRMAMRAIRQNKRTSVKVIVKKIKMRLMRNDELSKLKNHKSNQKHLQWNKRTTSSPNLQMLFAKS
jgi:hypothetical protein